MNKIAEIRKQRGLSQVDLAEIVGVEQPHISRLERGSEAVTLRLLLQVAEALRVDLAELFDDRTQAEAFLINVFRSLPPDRQAGWLDMARAVNREAQEIDDPQGLPSDQ